MFSRRCSLMDRSIQERLEMEAVVAQEDGLRLTISPCPRAGNDIISVQLTGTRFLAEVTIGNEPAAEESGPLATFLAESASLQTGQSFEWLSLCQDLAFTVSAESEFGSLLLLRVYMGSNSNDECDWQVNASLLLRPEQLRSFAGEVPVPQQ